MPLLLILFQSFGWVMVHETPYALSQDYPQYVSAINNLRAREGLRELYPDNRLMCAASIHAYDIAARRSCTQTGSWGETVSARALACNFPWIKGEQILVCGVNDFLFLRDLLQRRYNRKIVLAPQWRYVGLGYHRGFYVVIFSQ